MSALRQCTLVVCTLLIGTAAHAGTQGTPISACGDVVARHAHLTQDLECSGYDGAAVQLLNRATLDLNGFTVTGLAPTAKDRPPYGTEYEVVWCAQRCKVIGPGTLQSGLYGISVSPAEGVHATDNHRPGHVRVVDVDITDTVAGIHMHGRRVTAVRANIFANGYGIWGDRARVGESDIADNIVGVRADRLAIRLSSVTNNSRYAVWGSAVRAKTSSFVGSGEADIFTRRKPLLDSKSVCERSLKDDDPFHWSVCAND